MLLVGGYFPQEEHSGVRKIALTKQVKTRNLLQRGREAGPKPKGISFSFARIEVFPMMILLFAQVTRGLGHT